MRQRASDLARVWLRVMLVAGAVALVLAVSGGFGSDSLTILPRALYWLGMTSVGVVLGVTIGRRLSSQAWFVGRPRAAWATVATCITLPMALLAWAVTSLIRHKLLSLSIFLFDVLPGTLVTTAAITGLAFLTRDQAPTETHAAPPDAAPPKFLERLPAKLKGADVWAVEAQDHYLRLHTSKGRDLILMRLSDAVAELEGIEGARTHRSWWVARAAVMDVEKTEGRATLTLTDGSEAPVSRGYVKALKEAGWL